MSLNHSSSQPSRPTEWVHPEHQPGEVLLLNVSQRMFDQVPFVGKRMGTRAYDGEGNPLSFSDWYPVFVQASELDREGIDLRQARRRTRQAIYGEE